MSFPVKTEVAEVAARPKKLLESVHERLRLGHYSLRTEEVYVQWIVRYLKFEREQAGVWKHPRELGVVELKTGN
jgi:hypothetical protein